MTSCGGGGKANFFWGGGQLPLNPIVIIHKENLCIC